MSFEFAQGLVGSSGEAGLLLVRETSQNPDSSRRTRCLRAQGLF
uniref:Uncharacterized protein n=1 Tax=Anguilla anguilla TaxID=7936 RepID=A0A0E9UI40_ANGAN